MKKSQPIKNKGELDRFKYYYLHEKYNPRNHVLITMGLNTALRISDLLNLCWQDVYDFDKDKFRSHIIITEMKTQKRSVIFLNLKILETLKWYQRCCRFPASASHPLFPNSRNEKISRVTAYRIVHAAADACGIDGVISPHSLRKTFGYQAWQQGTSPVMLMDIYQHSSFDITKRYLGI